jgi:hypothetical protein
MPVRAGSPISAAMWAIWFVFIAAVCRSPGRDASLRDEACTGRAR